MTSRVKGKFFISVKTHARSDKGTYMGYKEIEDSRVASTDELKRTKILTEGWSAKFQEMQWMIRAKIADRPVVYRGK